MPWPLHSQERNVVPIAQKAGWVLWLVRMGAGNLTPTSVRIPDRPLTTLSWPPLINSNVIYLMEGTGEIKYPGQTKTSTAALRLTEGSVKARGRKSRKQITWSSRLGVM
jgi:hypothetical protein